jgi:hypothetical protein
MICPAENPSEETLKMVQGSLTVDTSRWYESDDEESEEGDADPHGTKTATDTEQIYSHPEDNEMF